MQKLATLTAAAALLMAVGFSGTAFADDNAETVTDVNTGTGSNTGFCSPCGTNSAVPGHAVDEDEDTWYSMTHNGDITVKFDDNVLIPDGSVAADLRISDRCGNIEEIDVEVSADGVNFVDVPGTFDDAEFGACSAANPNSAFLDLDLDPLGLPFVTHVRVIDLGEEEPPAGFDGLDLQNVVALSSLDAADIVITKTFAERWTPIVGQLGGIC